MISPKLAAGEAAKQPETVAPPEPKPPRPIPCGPEAKTWKNLAEVKRKLLERLVLETYKKASTRAPAWDDKALACIDSYIRDFAPVEIPLNYNKTIAAGEAALAAGCDEPLIGILMAEAYIKNGDQDKGVALMAKSFDKLNEKRYSHYVSCLALTYLAINEIPNRRSYAKYRDNDVEGNQPMEKLRAALLAKEFTTPDEMRLAYLLVREVVISPNAEFPDSFCTDQRLDPWLRAMIQGRREIELAWKERGGGWAKDVSKKGWDGFTVHIEKARDLLTKAWRINPQIPDAAGNMISVTMGGHGWKGVDERFWFDEAVAAQLDYMPAYYNLAWAMRPRWGGTHKILGMLALECADTKRYDTLVPVEMIKILRDIAGEVPDHRTVFRKKGVSPRIEAICEGMLADPTWQNSKHWILSQYANAELWCGNAQKTQELLQRVGDNYTETWVIKQCEFAAWENAPLDYVKAEAEALLGPEAEEFKQAQAASLAGEVGKAVAIYDGLCQKLKDDPRHRQVAINSMGFLLDPKPLGERNSRYSALVHLINNSDEANVEQQIKKLIENGANVNAVDGYNESCLVLALQTTEDDEIPLLLLQNGADPKANGNKSAVYFAAQRKSKVILKKLLEMGMDPNSPNSNNSTALQYAARRNDVETVKLLLEYKADINIAIPPTNSPLMMTTFNGSVETAKLLIDNGAKIDERNYARGLTPMHSAILNRNIEITKMLLDKGANVNTKTNDGVTPLQDMTYKREDIELLKLLLERKADPNIPSNLGWVALHVAVQENNLPALELLLQNGADTTISHKSCGGPPLFYAIKRNNMEAAKKLLEYKADPKATWTSKQWTGLHIAAFRGNMNFFKFFLEQGIDINALSTQDNSSPLMYAIADANDAFSVSVIGLGADITLCNSDGDSPLTLAARHNRPQTAKLLLEKGLDPHKKNSAGKDAFDLAKEKKAEATLKVLEEWEKNQTASK